MVSTFLDVKAADGCGRVRGRPEAKAASGARFIRAERAGGLGGAPLAPPSSMTKLGRGPGGRRSSVRPIYEVGESGEAAGHDDGPQHPQQAEDPGDADAEGRPLHPQWP